MSILFSFSLFPSPSFYPPFPVSLSDLRHPWSPARDIYFSTMASMPSYSMSTSVSPSSCLQQQASSYSCMLPPPPSAPGGARSSYDHSLALHAAANYGRPPSGACHPASAIAAHHSHVMSGHHHHSSPNSNGQFNGNGAGSASTGEYYAPYILIFLANLQDTGVGKKFTIKVLYIL